MRSFKKHLIQQDQRIKKALALLDELAADAILFVTDKEDKLLGSVTDGDVRRGFLRGLTFQNKVIDFVQPSPKFIYKNNYSIQDIIEFRKKQFRIIPVVNKDKKIVNVINFRLLKSYLPLDAVIMAGGRGKRLRPMTDNKPKPLLKIGDKPIIEHNLDRLRSFGIDDFWISIRYLGDQIEKTLGGGIDKNIHINYINEKQPLGTVGALSLIKNFKHDYILISNSDLLTNLNYEDFFLDFLKKDAALSVVTIPYSVEVPYAVLETNDEKVISFKEKPSYTYYSNGGIYLIKREIINHIPENKYFDTTDLMEQLLQKGLKVTTYPWRGYWLDIGKPEDFEQAQEDIKHITF